MAFPETSVLDDFNRTDEGPPLSSSWEDAHDDDIFEVSSYEAVYVKPTSKAYGGELYSAESFATTYSDVEAYVTIVDGGAFTSAPSPGVLLCCSNPGSTTLDGYLVEWGTTNSSTIHVYRIDNGSFTELDQFTSQTFVDGYKLGASIADDGTITVYKHTGSSWASVGTTSDTTYTSGYNGLWAYDGTETGGIIFDDFGGGQVADTLSASDVTSGTPAVDSTTLGQIHGLTSSEITAGTPTLETPVITDFLPSDDLTSTDLTAGTPVNETATLGQTHVISAADISTTPQLETSSIGVSGDVPLTSSELTSGTPAFDYPALAQYQALVAIDLLAGAPAFDYPRVNWSIADTPLSRVSLIHAEVRTTSIPFEDRSSIL